MNGYDRLVLSPNVRHSIGEADAIALDGWAKRIGATVAAGGKPGLWTVHVTAGALRESCYGAKGQVAVTIAALLVAIEEQQEQADRGFAPDELVTIAAQSGVAVSRA